MVPFINDEEKEEEEEEGWISNKPIFETWRRNLTSRPLVLRSGLKGFSRILFPFSFEFWVASKSDFEIVPSLRRVENYQQ